MNVLVVGASTEAVCGTRDSARTLALALEQVGASATIVWWERGRSSLRSWSQDIAKAPADVVLWHYSPFTYATGGVPTHALSALRAVRTAPLVTFFHELAFPRGAGGARGRVYAAAQEAALVPIVHASRGLVVTTEERRDWLASRGWLPTRPLLFTPVVSNVRRRGVEDRHETPRIGVFGFRRERLPVDVVTRAVATVPDARLALVGAPGPDSPEAEVWRRSADDAGVTLEFSGVVDELLLSSALESLDVVVFPDMLGPTTRRGTLAAALAHGRPVVAFDGAQTWRPFVDEGALDVVPLSTEALGTRLRELVLDDTLRAERSRRAEEFYNRRLDPSVVGAQLLAFLTGLADA